MLLKNSLASVPICGHPIQGLGYRLYTDASGIALAGALQQVQLIRVIDLKGTKAYECLQIAFEKGEPMP